MSAVSLTVSKVHFPVTTLGPGKRLGLWVQGCSIQCKGCCSADTWRQGKGLIAIPDLMTQLAGWLDLAEGITISGGEPFDQPEALEYLLQEIRKVSDADILLYSGYSFQALKQHNIVTSELIDCLISEPYDATIPSDSIMYGSGNQRCNPITKLGQRVMAQWEEGTIDQARNPQRGQPKFDIMFESGQQVWLAGLPKQGDLVRLEQLLEAQGHSIQTTLDASTKRMKKSGE